MSIIYKVGLKEIEGFGVFTCPVCNSVISPADLDEKTYKILEIKSSKGFVCEVLLQCLRCLNSIGVYGFESAMTNN